MDETDQSLVLHGGSQSGPGGLNGTNRKSKRPKKLEPLETMKMSQSQKNMTSTFVGTKKDLVEAVRRIAPASIETSPIIFREITGELKTTTMDGGNVKQQLSIVEDGVNNSARKYNDLKVACDRKTFELKAKLDELEGQKLQYDELCKMKKANTFESARIEAIKKDLAVVTDDLQRIDHQKRQLLHMLNRLNKNQILFEAHMNGMTDCYNAVHKEYGEVVLLRRGLDAGLAKTIAVHEATLNRVTEARHERAMAMAQRKNELKDAHRLKTWLKERAAQKIALSNGLRGDLTREEEHFLRMQVTEKEEKTRNLQKSNEENQKRAQLLERAFMRIKQLIGVATFEEIVEKFHMQRVNKVNIEREVKEVENRLSFLKSEYTRQEQQYRDMKSSGALGSAGDVVTRDMTVQLEEEIASAKNNYKLWRAELERLNNILISLQQGGMGLHIRATPFLNLIDGILSSTGTGTPGGPDRPNPNVDSEGSGGVFELTSSHDIGPTGGGGSVSSAHGSRKKSVGSPTGHPNGNSNAGGSPSPRSSSMDLVRPNTAERDAGVGVDTAMPESVWRETMEHLTTAEHVFSRMLEITAQPGQSPDVGQGSASIVTGGKRGQMGGTFIGSTFDGYAASFNAKDGYVDFSLRDPRNAPPDLWTDQNVDGGFINHNIRVVSKKNLRAHEALLMKQDESVYASALGGTAAGTTNNNALLSTFDNGDMGSQGSGETSLDLAEKTRPGTPGDTGVPVSDTQHSATHANLANQTVIDGDLLTRVGVKTLSVNVATEHNRSVQQELRQRKLLERMKQGGGPGQESALDKAARVKAQQDSAERLCVFRKPATLPEGSTLRDLPLEKTEAFLSKMPKLT